MDKSDLRQQVIAYMENHRTEIEKLRIINLGKTDEEIAANMMMHEQLFNLERDYHMRRYDMQRDFINLLSDIQRKKAEAEYRRKAQP